MRTVWLRLLAGLVAAGLLLTGCGGDSSEPKSQPKDSKSSPSASPSATPSELPAAAETKAGAIAFAKQYVGFINHAQATGGDTERMAGAETPDCSSCAQNRKAIEDFYGPEAKVEGGDWVIGSFATKADPAGGGWFVALAVTYGPQTVDRPGTQNDDRLKLGRLRVKFQLVWRDGSWKVAENTRIA